MLTSQQFDSLTQPIVDLYREFEDQIINDIARRIGNMSFSSAAWQAQRLSESGMLYEDILERISKITGKSESILRQTFEEAGVRAMKFDDSIYIKAGLQPVPLNLSPSMISVLKAGLTKTNGIMQNLTMTTALSGQSAFINAADLCYMEISTGSMGYDQAIRKAVKNLASQGINTVSYGKRTDFVDVSVRRATLTGVAQTTADLQLTRAGELGSDLLEMSAHAGARPSHQLWQGKIFSISGTSKKYPPFVESTGYGSVTGYAGANCRHSFYPFIEGYSQRNYTQKQLDEINNKTVSFNGKEISQTDASQIQRSLERNVRKYKREASALESAGIDNSIELSMVRKYQGQLRSFVKETGLYRQPAREVIN